MQEEFSPAPIFFRPHPFEATLVVALHGAKNTV
jgi:hypothetical protein